jgi:hypothetical protein
MRSVMMRTFVARKVHAGCVLGIETSCDDTGVAVVSRDVSTGKGVVHAHVLRSQWELGREKKINTGLFAHCYQLHVMEVCSLTRRSELMLL